MKDAFREIAFEAISDKLEIKTMLTYWTRFN